MFPWPGVGRLLDGSGRGSTSGAGLPTAAGGTSQRHTSDWDVLALVAEGRIEGVNDIDVPKFRKG